MADFDIELDASGLNCPLPVLKARKELNGMTTGQKLRLIATDTGADKDIAAFAKMTGNPLLDFHIDGEKRYFIIEKGAN